MTVAVLEQQLAAAAGGGGWVSGDQVQLKKLLARCGGVRVLGWAGAGRL